MKKRAYKDNSLKIFKSIAAAFIVAAVLILIGTVSTVDYEVETIMPENERMTREELTERIVFAGLFGVAGVLINYVVQVGEKELDRLDAKNNEERYEEW